MERAKDRSNSSVSLLSRHFPRLSPFIRPKAGPCGAEMERVERREWTEWGARMTRLTTGDERNELWGEESFNRPSSISALLLSSSPFLAATGPSPLVSVCRRSPTLHSSPRPKGSARCAAKEASMTWGGMSRDRRGAGPSFACHHHPWSGLVRSFHSLPILWPLLMIERLGSDESGPDMTDHGGSTQAGTNQEPRERNLWMVDFIMDFMGLFSLHNKIHKIRHSFINLLVFHKPRKRPGYGFYC